MFLAQQFYWQVNLALDPAPWLSLRVDVLAAFILLAVAFFGLLIPVYSVGYMKGHARQREYFTYLLWTLAVSCGVVLANDLLLLLVCWGFLALLLYLMAGISGPGAAGGRGSNQSPGAGQYIEFTARPVEGQYVGFSPRPGETGL